MSAPQSIHNLISSLDPSNRDPKELLYCQIIRTLNDIKITMGGSDLYATLRRHPEIRQFLVDYQKNLLVDYEKSISEL